MQLLKNSIDSGKDFRLLPTAYWPQGKCTLLVKSLRNIIDPELSLIGIVDRPTFG
jgi:hypothetical protein